MRLVEAFPLLDLRRGTRLRNDQVALGTSAGNSLSVDFTKTPARTTHLVDRATFHALQEWEGHVVEIGAETFEARLLDVTAGDRYDFDEATIPLEEVAAGDRERMEVGSIFRWVIGYERSPGGSLRRLSHIVFRDLPTVTAADERDGNRWAQEVMDKFGL